MKKGWTIFALFFVGLAIGVPMYVKSQTNPHAALNYTGQQCASNAMIPRHEPSMPQITTNGRDMLNI